MAKASKSVHKKIAKVMHEFGEGKLKSSSGGKVTNHKQAVAIAISEAHEEGLKLPPAKKPVDKKVAAKSPSKKKTATKKVKKK